MAEEVEMKPVEPSASAEPPKADPLAKPVKTLKLPPQTRPALKLPPKPGATVSALKPGLKLPPKPGATVAGLKPGATVTGLKPGLKLPPRPGATVSALKPGLKLPSKPVIHKPGATVTSAPLPKPVTPAAVHVDAQGVAKLPTVAAQSIPRDEAAAVPVLAEAEKPMEALKHVTQKLKGVTQHLPAEAVLHKTGIIAEGAVTEAQKEAAKHKTARISLADAMGVAPVKDEHAPMKTIRIKRPVNIPTTSTQPLKRPENLPPPAPVLAAAESAADPVTLDTVAAPPQPHEEPKKADTASVTTTVTQRKTLKIARPGGGAIRPTGKFGLKRPTVQTQAKTVSPGAEGAASTAAPSEGVADIADIPEMPSVVVPPVPTPKGAAPAMPAWLATILTLVQAAACVAIGALAWMLYQNSVTQYF